MSGLIAIYACLAANARGWRTRSQCGRHARRQKNHHQKPVGAPKSPPYKEKH
jgi:hypothetical protein